VPHTASLLEVSTDSLSLESWEAGGATAGQSEAVRSMLGELNWQYDPPLSERAGGIDACHEAIMAAPGYLARLDGEQAGFLSYVDYPEKEHYPGPVRYVNYVGVRDRFKGNGVGRALMEVFDRDAARDGIHATGGRTWGSNTGSQALFISRGYKAKVVADTSRRTSNVSVYFFRPEPPALPSTATKTAVPHPRPLGLLI
jgi:GNAT superfamily N-acetyltransferase